ncbi:hypothetical protein [Botrimarina mediterranea]|uniref:PEP-CTERM protein-sorting domain-containing protein n=1 Tax=Botrimarina mediterranea TaxID=2528022 RepID=A0A518K3Z2_9BACT|nr:hypothetical protein [Botrimarina mediterranea]QDV72510.1 hypothetical protein Spa11_06880 [Botrimarina mediterranea]QDV77082.1 hypothetical protein K2D_06690 [Planctomycetes bacterium K2D]
MKRHCFAASIALALSAGIANAGPIGLVDDFSGSLGSYTATRILKATPAAPDNTAQWEVSGGSLQLNTSVYGGIEQYALTRTDVTLGVGEELQADYLGGNLDSQDIGLYVGAGHPAADVRADYVNVYIRNNGQLFSRGFDGLTEMSLGGGATPTNLESLFIKRLATDVFELGYYNDGGLRNIVSTRTISGGNAAGIGDAIGFYADVRAAGVRGNMDNLRIVPEPAAGLLALGMAGVAAMRRRR